MLHLKYVAFRTWLAAYTHVHLRELSTKIGLVVTAIATVLPNFARFDVRIAYVAAGAGVVMMLLRGPDVPAPKVPDADA